MKNAALANNPIKQEIINTTHPSNLLLVDRDGTLNIDKGYTFKTTELEIRYDVVSELSNLVLKNTAVVCVTNQSGVGRGLYTIDDVFAFNTLLARKLTLRKFTINAFYICPHSPEMNCMCRKPKAKMLDLAMSDYNVNTKCTTFIGNSEFDELAGVNAGIKYISVNNSDFRNKILKRRVELSAY